MPPQDGLSLKVEKSTDELANKVTTVKCHGRLVIETAAEMKDAVKPLIPLGGRIVLGFGRAELYGQLRTGDAVGPEGLRY